jgi:hypothetical protein
MAQYRFQGSDGKTHLFEGPSGLNQSYVNLFASNLLNPEPAVREIKAEEPKGATGFLPSVMRGGRGLASLLTDVAPAMAAHAFGYDDYAKKQLEEAAAYQKETEKLYPAEVASYKDIDTVGKALTYVKESIGEAIPSIIPSILTGGAAAAFSRPAIAAAEKAAQSFAEKQLVAAAAKGPLSAATVEGIKKAALDTGAKEAQKIVLKYEASGALAGSALQNIPDVYQNIYETTGKQDLGAALAFGSFNAALDAVTPISLLRKMRKSGISPEEVGAAWYKRAGKGALQGFVTEGGTEALQEVSSAAAENFVDKNQEFFSEKNFERFINAGLKGGFGGAGITAATDTAFGKGPEKQAAATPETPAPAVTPGAPVTPPAPSDITGMEGFKIHPPGFTPTNIVTTPAIKAQEDVIIKAKKELAAGVHSDGTALTPESRKLKQKKIAREEAKLQDLIEEAKNVGQPIATTGGKGAIVPSATSANAPTGGIGGAQPAGVVRPGEDVASTAVGKTQQPAPVNYTVQDLLASGEADKDVPDFTAPKQEAPIGFNPQESLNELNKLDAKLKKAEKQLLKDENLETGNPKIQAAKDNLAKVKAEVEQRKAELYKQFDEWTASREQKNASEQTLPVSDRYEELRKEIEEQEAAEGQPRKPFSEQYVPPVIKTPEEIEAEKKAAFEAQAAEAGPMPAKKDIKKQIKATEAEVASLYDEEKDVDNPDERSKLPFWSELTVDQRNLYLGFLHDNNALEHEAARKALIRYRDELRAVNKEDAKPELDVLNQVKPEDFTSEEEYKKNEVEREKKLKRLKQSISKLKAEPAAAAYVFNRAAESEKQKFTFPEWSALTTRQRKIFQGTLEGLVGKRVENGKPVTDLNKATAEEISLAFNRLGQVLIRRINAINEARKPTNTAYEEAQAEINEKQEEIKEKEREERESEANKTAAQKASERKKREAENRMKPGGAGWLPDHVVNQIKNKNFDAVMQYLRTHEPSKGINKDPIPRAVGQLLYGLKLKTKIKFVDKLPKKRVAEYDPKSDTISVTSNGLTDRTILHEVVHAATVKVINEYLTKYKKNIKHSLTNDQVDAMEHLEDIMEYAQSEMSNSFPDAFENLYEFVGYALSNKDFQDSLANLDTENKITRNLIGRELPEHDSLWSDFMLTVVNMLGWVKKFFYENGQLKRDNALLETLNSFEKIIAAPPEEGIEMASLPAVAAQVLQAGAPTETRSPEQIIKDALESVKIQRYTPKSVLSSIFSKAGYNKGVELLQNDRAPLKKLYNYARKFPGLVTLVGPKPNDVQNNIVLSSGKAVDIFQKELYLDIKDLDNSIEAYAQSLNLPIEDALARLHLVFQALHEPERRRVKFLMDMKLENDSKRIEFNGEHMSTARFREKIIEEISKVSPGLTDEQRKKKFENMRKALDAAVFDKNGNVLEEAKDLALSEAERAAMYNEGNAIYDVIASRTPEEEALFRGTFGTPETDPAIKDIRDRLEKIRETTIKLNKEANYWSEPVSNVVNFYGFENYVPFKGMPKDKERNEEFNFDSIRIGGEFQEGQDAFGGRKSESNNPVLQLRADAVSSALRAGRRDTAETIVNAIEAGIIEGNHVADITFSQRYGKNVPTDKLSKIRGIDKIFWYKPDGTISVYKIKDKDLSNAIKRNYRESSPLTNLLDSITSGVGMWHTRYNPSFGPMNFVRDIFTNAGIIGAEYDPATGARLISAISSDVINGGFARSLEFATLYTNGNFEKINELAGGDKLYESLTDRERYYRDMSEYVTMGGKVSYIQGVAAKGALEQIMKEVGRSGIMKKKDQFNKFVDVYNDTLEMASRVGTYRMLKDIHFKQNKEKGMSDADALQDSKMRTAEYVKNLANFEQMGRYGKIAGAMFMFFRPAATGAVRAIDALAPMFRLLPPHMGGFDEAAFRKKAVKEGRNAEQIDAAVAAMYKEATTAGTMALVMAGVGTVVYMMALMMAGDDEQGRNRVVTDDMSRWTRYARIFIPGFERPLQIAWGFGPGAFAAAAAQVAAIGTGRVSVADAFSNILVIGMDSFLPLPVSHISPVDNFPAFALDSIAPSVVRPFFEYVMNLDGLGREIYNNRQSRYGDAYTGGDSIPEAYKWVARKFFDSTEGNLDYSPNVMYFFANNYLDGAAKAFTAAFDVGYTLTGQKDFDLKYDLPLLGSFIGTKSNVDAREFNKVETQVKAFDKRINSLKDKPELLDRFMQSEDAQKQFAAVQFYNHQVNGQLRQLRASANQVRADNKLNPRERKVQLDEIIKMENIVKSQLLNVFADMGVTP